MFKKTKTPKHLLFIGEKSETRDYIIEVIKNSVENQKDKTPTHTFSTLEINFNEEIRSELLKRTDGAIFLIDAANMEDHSKLKEYLWEYFVWNIEAVNIPVLIMAFNAERALALTSAEIIEAYSLIRLTDRLWNVKEIYENKSEDILACFSWLDDYIEVLGIKPKAIRKKTTTTEKK
ncbi:MAG: ADP-ribosylation factor-like protein [Candidatus Thorarchaeota archaeon]